MAPNPACLVLPLYLYTQKDWHDKAPAIWRLQVQSSLHFFWSISIFLSWEYRSGCEAIGMVMPLLIYIKLSSTSTCRSITPIASVTAQPLIYTNNYWKWMTTGHCSRYIYMYVYIYNEKIITLFCVFSLHLHVSTGADRRDLTFPWRAQHICFTSFSASFEKSAGNVKAFLFTIRCELSFFLHAMP